MTWSYSGDPDTSTTDSVRFLIGDTDSSDPQIQNEELEWSLEQNGADIYLTAISSVRRLIVKYARRANKSSGNLSLQSASISKQYKDTLSILIAEANKHTAIKPFSGGLYEDDMETNAQDDSLADPSFTIGQDDSLGEASAIEAGFIRSFPA